MDLWADRSHTISLRVALSSAFMFGQLVDIALDGFQNTLTHTQQAGEQVQMKGNFQYWWAEPCLKKRRPNPSQERKSQTIIRQKPKIYWRSLKTDFSVVELDEFINFLCVDCKYS